MLLKMKRTKHIISICAFIASLIAGFTALFIPPTGIIDHSVLWWVAQLLCFTSAMLGVDFDINHHYNSKHNDDE